MKPALTLPLCYAAGRDAGNRSMRKAGRTAWNEDDYNAAAEVFARLALHLGRRYSESPAWPEYEKGTT